MTKKELQIALEKRRLHNENIFAVTKHSAVESIKEKKTRIDRLKKNYAAFCEFYFPHYCTCPAGDFHIETAKRILANRNPKEVLEWARGHAKSTNIDIFVPMWLMIQDEREFNVMVLVSQNKDKADTLLEDIKSEFQYNQRFIADFGEQYNPAHWSIGEFVTKSEFAFFSRGRGQSPNGLRYRQHRPDLIIIDDLDDDEEVLNADRVKKYTKWVKESLFATMDGGRGRFLMVGNLLSKQSVLQNIINSEGVTSSRVNILDKNGNVTWKGRWTLDEVKKMEDFMGARSFQKEYMNNPTSEGDVFKEITFGKCPRLSDFKALICYSDPSPSNNVKAKNSTKAVVLIGCLNGKYYVLDCRLDRATNAEFVDWICDINASVPESVQIYNFIENNSLQNPFYEQVIVPAFREKANSLDRLINIMPDTRKKPDKFSRIEANLEPLNRQGLLIFNEKYSDNPHYKRLEEQFLGVTPKLSLPADGPDAVEGGVWKAKEKLNLMSFQPRMGRQTNNKYTW